MKWFLAIWIVSPSNYAVYEEFNSFDKCDEKKLMVEKALKQAESQMKVECRAKNTKLS